MAAPRPIGGPNADDHKRTLGADELAQLRQNEQQLGRSPPVPNVPMRPPSAQGQLQTESGPVRWTRLETY